MRPTVARLFAGQQSAIGTPMTSHPDTSVPHRRRRIDRHDLLRISIVWAALIMNFFLALANNNGIGMNANIVLAVQLLLTIVAIIVIAYEPPLVGPSFIVSMAIIILGYLVAGLFQQKLELKGLYEILIIPIFILLGLTLHQFGAWMINVPMAVTTLFALADGLLREQFAAVVNPLSYYRATRAWFAASNAAFSADNGLYLGADRPNGSFFSFISDHRVGSIFLEPLSLAYFSVIAVIAYAVLYRNDRSKFYVGAASCLFLTLLADTRTATLLVLLALVIFTVSKNVSKIFVYITPVVVLIVGALIYVRTGGGGGSELVFRLGLTYKSILSADSLSFFLGDVSSEQIYDSGVISIIQNVGVISAFVIIYMISGVYLFRWRATSYVPLMAMLYVMVTLLFGGAIFSIKTAALYGLVIGVSGRINSAVKNNNIKLDV